MAFVSFYISEIFVAIKMLFRDVRVFDCDGGRYGLRRDTRIRGLTQTIRTRRGSCPPGFGSSIRSENDRRIDNCFGNARFE